jgi:hypothetical protein
VRVESPQTPTAVGGLWRWKDLVALQSCRLTALASEFGSGLARPATPMKDAADCAGRYTDAVEVE